MSGYDLKIKSGKYFKLEPNTPVDLRLLNEEPFERSVHGFGREQSECQGEDCPECAKGSDARQTWSTNIYDWNDRRVKIWSFGATVAKQLKKHAQALGEEDKKLTGVDLRVLKTGSGQDTEYTVTTRTTARDLPKDLTLFPLDLPF